MINNQIENKYNLLVIDDEVEITKSLYRQFRMKYNVYVATSAEDALPILEKEHIQVILSDQRMPGMTGIDLYGKIKDKYPDAIKLILTGYSDIEVVIGAINEGQVFRYLTKPWDPKELDLTIDEAFQKYELITKNRLLMNQLSEANESLEKKVKKRTKELEEHKENLEKTVKERTEELEKAKEKAEESDRLKSAFLTNMRHEIRTPMNSIVGYANLLKGIVLESKPKEFLNYIIKSSNQLLNLIIDILTLSEIDAGEMELSTEWVEVKSFFNEIVADYRQEIDNSNVTLYFDLQTNVPVSVLIDTVKVRKLIDNILSNAIKFTLKGYVRFTIESEFSNSKKSSCSFRFIIEDSGISISEAYKKMIFKPFSQEDYRDNRNYEGVGIGLAISKKLVELMNGNIEVNSEVDKGSVFVINIPDIECADENKAVFEKLPIEINTIQFNKATILLVDEMEYNRESISLLMQNKAIALNFASNGEEAFEMIKNNGYDLILANIEVPILDGFGLLEMIRKDSQIKDLPVIALSSIANSKNKKAMKDADFNALLTLPIQIDNLYLVLTKFLKYTQIEPDLEPEKSYKSEGELLSLKDKEDLYKILNGNLMVLWKELDKRQSLKSVRSFAKELEDLSINYPCNALKELAQELLLALGNFDIVEIANLLKRYPLILASIKD